MVDLIVAPRTPTTAMGDAGGKARVAGKLAPDIYGAMLDEAYADQVVRYFVIFNEPGRVPEKKGGWSKEEHLIAFLRDAMLLDRWKPGARITVLELTWDADLWASSASEYLAMHDDAIGKRAARAAWLEARAKHVLISKAQPSMALGSEIQTFRKATAVEGDACA